jgi:maltooligosyltrehalose trehalohydrolase
MHHFRVWAPRPKKVSVQVNGKPFAMEGPNDQGYWNAKVDDAGYGATYGFLLDDDEMLYPDPRSFRQPDGVHGPSVLYDQKAFAWSDSAWQGYPLASAIIYELHIGTFTKDGTFDSAIERLGFLQDLGITHIEVMPVSEWAGNRGWGYDGVDLFAVYEPYGGPDAFKRFVDACHHHCMGVILDVVYNHLGPVGNYTGKFGPYITDRHKTPWGDAINFERDGSDEVRKFFLDNALMWMQDFHVDGLRLDAIHEIWDRSAVHFLEALSAEVNNLSATFGKRLMLIAESDLNDPKIVRSIEANGYGMSAQWTDDFHHSLATILFTEPGHRGYYDDFGGMEAIAKAIKDVFVFEGQYSKYRNHSHGRPVDNISAHHFINFLQNHDQVGNRALGDRIQVTIGIPRTKAALGLILTAPYLPMIFMGEEYAASTPFLYFADHEDPEMAKLVSEGRRREFADFGFDGDAIPNPEDPDVFERSKLNWSEVHEGVHQEMLDWVKALIHLRRNSICLNDGDRGHLRTSFSDEGRWLRMDRGQVTCLLNLGDGVAQFKVQPDRKLTLTADPAGTTVEGESVTLSPNGFAVFSAEGN